MAEPSKPSGQNSENVLRSFVHLILGPTVWLLHFALVYAVQSTFCALASHVDLVPLAIVFLTALALIVLAAAAWRLSARNISSGFLHNVMLLLFFLVVVGIGWTCLAALLLHPCSPLR